MLKYAAAILFPRFLAGNLFFVSTCRVHRAVRLGRPIGLAVAAACAAGGARAQTAPGTVITNVADVSYVVEGTLHQGRSNAATITVEGAGEAATLNKTQVVRARDGSATPTSGAVVTYALAATFAAAGARGAAIEDPVPAGTTYLAGSLTLDGAPLSDAAGDDAGECDGRLVRVALGDVAAAVTRTVTFQVRLP